MKWAKEKGQSLLKSIEIENYRSFAQPARVIIRPITILLGRNSAGKSSLTRLFPLLKQSMARETSAPILWTSTSIDFGRIGDVISRSRKGDSLKLRFELATGLPTATQTPPARLSSRTAALLRDRRVEFTASLSANTEGKTEYESFTVKLDDDEATVLLRRGELVALHINGSKIDTKAYGKSIFVDSGRIFTAIYFEDDHGIDEISTDATDLLRRDLEYFVEDASQLLGDPSREPEGRYRTRVVANSIPFISRAELPSYLSKLPGVREGHLDDSNKLDSLFQSIFVAHLGMLLSTISESLTPVFETSSYMGPIRSSGSRFYREQELSVERIDERGDNLAIYLNSLSPHALKDFNLLLSRAFGVKVRSHSDGGHLSIELSREDTEDFDNLSDVGFGFSQLLPLVAQLHSNNRRRFIAYDQRNVQHIMAIEQPELHLHPAFQSNLADLFAAAIVAPHPHSRPVNLVLETHSEALISRLGELIVEGKLNPEDVILHFVEKDDQTGESTVRIGEYDSAGAISNWPLGFFSAR